MTRRPLSCAALAILILSVAPIARADHHAKPVAWEPALEMDGQIYPSYVLSTANVALDDEADKRTDVLGDENGLIGIAIDAPHAGATVHIDVHAPALFEDSSLDATLEKNGDTYWVYPKLRYDYGKLLNARQAMPVNVTLKVSIDGKPAESKDVTVQLRSTNECPFILVHADDADDNKQPELEDLGWMFAAYVNEDHPMVDKVLKDALAEGVVGAFDGYQAGDPEDVLGQVFAVWRTLQRKGVKYSDISTTANASEVVVSQHVRFMDESVTDAQANCVDGSVLMASVLRKIGIEPSLVLIPGHCFLAFSLDAKGENMVGLETTLLGSADLSHAKKVDAKGEQELAEKYADDPSMKTFVAALQIGSENLEKNVENFKAEDPRYQLVNIAEARKAGVAPIAARLAAGK